MIKVDRIRIVEFRGIRDLTIDINGTNFAVSGPNGTGKSGIVDALEFGLSGTISRLSGKGQGSVSVKDHGPHVNSRNEPEKAVVTIDVTIPSLGGKKATITRNVKSPRTPLITPNDADILAVFGQIQKHPEFCLSRREIIKYVLAEPGVRAAELQALLQLDKLESARSLFLKIANAEKRDLKVLNGIKNTAAESLMRAFGIAEIKGAVLLEAANAKRAVLDLPPLTKLGADTSIRDGLETQAAVAAVNVPKAQAKTDIIAATAMLDAFEIPEAKVGRKPVVDALLELKANEARLTDVARDALLESALSLFDEKHCPVCQTEWLPADFRDVVGVQRRSLKLAAEERASAEKLLEPLIEKLEQLPDILRQLAIYARNLTIPIDTAPLATLHREVKLRIAAVRQFLPLDLTIAAIETPVVEIGPALEMLKTLLQSVNSLPDLSDRDSARDYLTVGQERLENWRQAMTKHAVTSRKADISEKVLEVFAATVSKELEAIYKDVEVEFRSYYRDINGDDESKFEAQLSPSLGKLGFEVDFYGKGFFPPGAYHSEGHQDGMGLCLYLALMKYLLGEQFTFAVLDDVLMSVDAGHRREVCNLLKSRFPNTQFVLTTHDNVWLNHMKTVKLISNKSAITFRKWHVDSGPAEWKQSDVWSEIDDAVDKNEIRAAAGQLRHYLEYASAEWCARLGGRVEYRNDGKYELGDLLPAAIGAMNDLYKKAKVAAGSWNDKARIEELVLAHSTFSAAVTAATTAQWEINPAVHYNEWANFQKEDFKPIVQAFKTLERLFACDVCGSLIYVVRTGKTLEAARCGCNKINLNLKIKAKEAAAPAE